MDPLLLMKVVWFSLIMGSNSHTCSVRQTMDIDHLINCRRRHLDSVPSDITDPWSVTSLDLSGNNITSLAADVFEEFPRLVNLNLSTAGIQKVHEAALRGLDHLEVLDLTNNDFLYIQKGFISHSFFEGCPHLTKLYISGHSLRESNFSSLRDLEEVTLTPNISYMPYELGQLSRLRVLNFAFCQGFRVLYRELLLPFSNAPLEEIAFHSCGLQHVEYGTFDNFTNLRLLNFACNNIAYVPYILDVLSAGNRVQIEYLVLDMVGNSYYTAPVTLGRLRNGECYRVWEFLKHLSIRGTHWQWVERLSCMKNLVSFAGGFNSPHQLAVDQLHWQNPFGVLEQMRYADYSHLFVPEVDSLLQLTGCQISASWIPPNHSYFPKINPEWDDDNCTRHVLKPDTEYRERCKNNVRFFTFDFPPCLTYLKVDHLAFTDTVLENICLYYPQNNLRYLNFSHKFNNQDWYNEYTNVMGLDRLEIADMCDYGLLDYNKDMAINFPNLKELYLCQNSLGLGNMTQFTHVPLLRVLDLSDNKISSIPSNMFAHLHKLELLNLNLNHIQSVDWLSPQLTNLNILYLSGNEISHIDVEKFRPFERRTNDIRLHLDLGNNPLLCGCDQLDAVTWLQSTNISFVDRNAMNCKDKDPSSSVFAQDVDAIRDICDNVTLKIVMGTVTVAIAIFLIVGSILLYRYRWWIKWKYYKARYIRKREHIELRQIGDRRNAYTFSTFIIYPQDDSQASHWVIHDLRNKIETEWGMRDCFIRGRNDLPGNYEIDNIVAGLTQSQTALWVICPAFFEDRWCEMAANYAFHQLGVHKNAFIIMERLDEYRVPKQFANLLNPKMGSPRFRYTDDDDGRRLFWSTLEAFISA